jgi:hypothetical protein
LRVSHHDHDPLGDQANPPVYLAAARDSGLAVELIDGELVRKAIPKPEHGSAQVKLGECDCEVRAPHAREVRGVCADHARPRLRRARAHRRIEKRARTSARRDRPAGPLGIPVAKLPASIAAKVLNGGPGNISINVNLAGTPAALKMADVKVTISIGASRHPLPPRAARLATSPPSTSIRRS